jgi:hypothetical protein
MPVCLKLVHSYIFLPFDRQTSLNESPVLSMHVEYLNTMHLLALYSFSEVGTVVCY